MQLALSLAAIYQSRPSANVTFRSPVFPIPCEQYSLWHIIFCLLGYSRALGLIAITDCSNRETLIHRYMT